MRALIQRVSSAECVVDGRVTGSCGLGYLVLLGVGDDDTQAQADQLLDKIAHLRIFDDENGKVNLSLLDVGGSMLVVSQFTLFADCRRGRRPSFTAAGSPDVAVPLYDYFCDRAEGLVGHVGRGIFGADMKVTLTNDGPFTIWLDTDELSRPRR